MSRKEAKTKVSVEKDEDPSLLLSNYIDCCKQLGIGPNDIVRDALTTAVVGNSNGGKQLILNLIEKQKQKLGHLGCLALCSAIRGNFDGAQGVITSKNANVIKLSQSPPSIAASISYKALKELRIWSGAIGDEGVISVSSLLLLGSPDIQLCFLEVISVSTYNSPSSVINDEITPRFSFWVITRLKYRMMLVRKERWRSADHCVVG